MFGSGYLEVMTPSEIEDLKNNNNIFKAKRKVHYVFEDSNDIERCRCIHTYMIEHAYIHTYIHRKNGVWISAQESRDIAMQPISDSKNAIN